MGAYPDEYTCVDVDGFEWPEHTEGDICRRCGAEMYED